MRLTVLYHRVHYEYIVTEVNRQPFRDIIQFILKETKPYLLCKWMCKLSHPCMALIYIRIPKRYVRRHMDC